MKLGCACCVVVSLLAACSGSDTDSESQALCDDLTAKVSECMIDVDTSMGCKSNLTEAEKCAAGCVIEAECADISGPVQNNPYYRCVAVCSGAGPDDFICSDGSGYLPPAGVCDGMPQCPDGSDEASCP